MNRTNWEQRQPPHPPQQWRDHERERVIVNAREKVCKGTIETTLMLHSIYIRGRFYIYVADTNVLNPLLYI